MSTYRTLDWYDTPRYYDLVFDADTKREADFLEAVDQRYGRAERRRARTKRVLEPACGSGRLVVEMARRGWEVAGFDLSGPMLDYAQKRLARRGLEARLELGRLEEMAWPRRYDLAHCLVSTFKYVLDEAGARAHLQGVADALLPGGVYVLGFHLSEYANASKVRERWVVKKGATEVVCNIQSWPPDRRARLERVRSRLRVQERGRELRSETEWQFRTYDARQVRRLLRSVPELELVALHDFVYDIEWTRELDDSQLDCVFVLRRRA